MCSCGCELAIVMAERRLTKGDKTAGADSPGESIPLRVAPILAVVRAWLASHLTSRLPAGRATR